MASLNLKGTARATEAARKRPKIVKARKEGAFWLLAVSSAMVMPTEMDVL